MADKKPQPSPAPSKQTPPTKPEILKPIGPVNRLVKGTKTGPKRST